MASWLSKIPRSSRPQTFLGVVSQVGIRLARPLQRLRDGLPRRHHHQRVEALDRNPVAGLHDEALGLGREGHVRVHVLDISGIVQLNVRAVVHEGYDGHALRQRGNAAHVVAIVVRHHHIIDLLDAEGLAGFHDAVRLAAAASVDNHTLSGGRNQQERLPSFNIDDIHVERLGR